MRLFLSSYRFGEHFEKFLALVGVPGDIAVVGNACDAWPEARATAVKLDIALLADKGFTPRELDLRDFIGTPAELEKALSEFPAMWVRGGNTFVLRAQFARSGADQVLKRLLARDALVYAGHSAGACIMCPDLHGLEAVDDPAEVMPTCGIASPWEGLGLVEKMIVPHVDSLEECAALAARLRTHNIGHWAFTDADALVVEGTTTTVYAR